MQGRFSILQLLDDNTFYRLRDSVNETVQQLYQRLHAAYERVHAAEINNLVQQQQELDHACIVAESGGDHAAAEKFRQGLAWCDDLSHLSQELTLALRRLRNKSKVIQSFFAQAGLEL